MWNEGRIPFYRFGLALYYLHYYFNIFLLAAMSVERCIAVWKSMRCLRHDIAVSFYRIYRAWRRSPVLLRMLSAG